ncbi:acyl-CoA dehydrogenase family protein [Paenibacillus sp. GCM10027626]|uniref:acyl-CoA dehydrogenase family protein n=1 Tax=Paenibacillus sp. GCM10027626 TaxID=3273411 RepID=UPI00363312C7
MAQRHKQSGRFVIDDCDPDGVAIPEELALAEQAEAALIAAQSFIRKEIRPHVLQVEAPDYEQMKRWMRRAGELQLLECAITGREGGVGQYTGQAVQLSETFAEADYFSLSLDAHIHLGIAAIAFFGTEDQKNRYLADLCSGKKIAAYGLTEQRAGSDALSIKTTARLSPDKQFYMLHGTKLYVTNAGIAELFIIFAKVDGDDFTAFLVDRCSPGLHIGAEERTMGMEGASICPVTLDSAAVPVCNVLGTVGKGHHVAFNILNYGRFHQAAGCLGRQKLAIGLAAQYAIHRKQFGRMLAAFPLIACKLAEMNTAAYVTESMLYRMAGELDQAAQDVGTDAAAAFKLWDEYALECSLNKVFASEALAKIVDEAVQIYGGRGYSRTYEVEHLYRAARLSRISEGTNEINRILVPGMLMKKALKGELPLLRKARQLQSELAQPEPPPPFAKPLDGELFRIRQAKKVFLAVGGLAVQKYGLSLEQEQEMLAMLSDMIIAVYAMESAALRTIKRMRRAADSETETKGLQTAVDMTVVWVYEAMEELEGKAKRVLASLETGEELQVQLMILKRLLRAPLPNIIHLKRNIAASVIRNGQYVT